MKITMKNMVSVVAAAVLTLAIGVAYAGDDQISFMGNNDTGTALYNAFVKHDAAIGTGSATGGQRADAVGVYVSDELPTLKSHRDIGSELRDAHLKQEAMKSSAAGGVRVQEVDRSNEYTSDTMPVLNQQR